MKLIIDPNIKGSTERVKKELDKTELVIKNYICSSGTFIGIYATKNNVGPAGASTQLVLIAFDRGNVDSPEFMKFDRFSSDEHNLCRVQPLDSDKRLGMYKCLTDKAYNFVDRFIDGCVEELITYLLDDVTPYKDEII